MSYQIVTGQRVDAVGAARRRTGWIAFVLLACGLTLSAQSIAPANQAGGPSDSEEPACRIAADQPARTLSGTVSDEQGARVQGATVTVTCGTFTRRTQTTPDGAFTLELPPGEYTLRVESPGFEAFKQDTTVTAGQDAQVPVTLGVKGLTDEVTVAAQTGVVRNVAAGRTDTPLLETPQAISVITHEQIEAQGAQTMQDVVRYTAGVRAEMYGVDNRGDWFTMRGGSEGSTLLDGLRLPLSGWWGNVRNEPYAFDRVEVLRGPSSALFGQNGPGGIVNLVSKLPQAQARQEVQLQLGNFAQKQIAADLTGPATDDGRLQYRLVTLFRDADTQVDYADEERQFVSPSIAWRPSSRTSLTAYGQYQRDRSKNNVGFFPWEGMLLPAPNGPIPTTTFIGEPEWDTYGGTRRRGGYQVEHRFNDTWHLRQDFRYDDVEGDLLAMYANFFEGGLLEDERSVNRTWYASNTKTRVANAALFVDGHFRLGPTEHTVLAGIDGVWSRDSILDTEGAAPPLDVYTPTYGLMARPTLEFPAETPVRTRQGGVVVQDQIKLADRLSIVAGLRRAYVRTEVTGSPEAGSDDSAWTGRVGAVYLLPKGFAPYASFSNSFEAVTGTDVYGAPFQPKRGEQVEGGLKWAPPSMPVTMSAAVYDLTEKNRLTTDPQNPVNQVQRGEVSVQGVELEANTNWRAWNVIANYTYTDATVSASSDPEDPYLGHRLQSIPKHSTALWVMHNFAPRGGLGLQAGVGVRYVGETWDGTDTLATPSNTLADAVFSIDRGPWKYAINATNLFDKTYLATCLDRGDCWYGARRRIVGTLTFRH